MMTIASAARALGVCIALSFASIAAAASWKPANPVEIVVPNTPGGGNDAFGRLLQRVWTDRKLVHTTGVVVNKPGAGGTVALTYLNQKANDPHAMSVVSITQQLNYLTGASPLWHRHFTPLAVMIGDYIGYAVRADSPITNGRDLIARLKKDPAAMVAGITGIGGNNHIAYVMAARSAGVDPRRLKTPVFQSSAESITALLGGHIDVHIGSVGPLIKQHEAGRLRVIAITSDQRLAGAYAAVPTWKELGITGTFNTWRGLWAPKGLGSEHLAFWDGVLEKTSRDAHWQEVLGAHQWQSDYRNSRDTLHYLDAVHTALRDVLKDLGLAKRVE